MSQLSNPDEWQSPDDPIGAGAKVLTPSGFGVVMSLHGEKAIVQLIREDVHELKQFDTDQCEMIDEREWIVYEEGPTETPYR